MNNGLCELVTNCRREISDAGIESSFLQACPARLYTEDNLAMDRMVKAETEREREIVGFCLLKK
jgi:hypothetical protein